MLLSFLLLPQGLPQGPIRLTTARQLWLQITATGSAAHPPSTQSDGNWKSVCIHLLPASFVCAVKTIFLLRTSDKKCRTKSVLDSNRRPLFLDQDMYGWTTACH